MILNQIALKPCPFCGGEASKSMGLLPDKTPFEYVECIDCAATAESVEGWNTRCEPGRNDNSILSCD